MLNKRYDSWCDAITKLEGINGYINISEKTYVLLERVSQEGKFYTAKAICLKDEIDEKGFQKCYMMRWEISEDYDPEYDDEDNACDWESPVEIKVLGVCNAEQESISKVMFKIDNFQDGLLALCDCSYSIAQCLDSMDLDIATLVKPICECELCQERLGMIEIENRKEQRKNWFKKVTFEEIYRMIQNYLDSEYYNPYACGNGIVDIENGFRYCTGGGLAFEIEKLKDEIYTFKVFHPSGNFSKGSTLMLALEKRGFKLVSETDSMKDFCLK